jgi:hypothetical protein
LLVESSKDSNKVSSASKNGFFKNVVDSGTYITTVKVNPSYYKVIPASITSTFNSSDKSDSVNFLIQAISNIRDYRINLFTADRARPGFGMDYTIECANVGTDTLQNKTVSLVLSSK